MTSDVLKLSCRLFSGMVLAVFIATSASYAAGGTLKPTLKPVSPSAVMSVKAALMIRQGESIELYPPGSNSEVSRQCDIYRLNSAWQTSPQPLYDFYPGTFLQSFSLFGENETAHIDLLNVVKDWAAGQANHGLMLRGPVNRSQYAPSASVNYYHSVKLVGWYLE